MCLLHVKGSSLVVLPAARPGASCALPGPEAVSLPASATARVSCLVWWPVRMSRLRFEALGRTGHLAAQSLARGGAQHVGFPGWGLASAGESIEVVFRGSYTSLYTVSYPPQSPWGSSIVTFIPECLWSVG